jgi:hypothetical protein
MGDINWREVEKYQGVDVAASMRMRYEKVFPAEFFLPNRPQAHFIKDVGTLSMQGVTEFLLTSANGVGKTSIVINILINIVYGNINLWPKAYDKKEKRWYNGFFNYPLFNSFPSVWPKEIWYVSSRDNLESIFNEFQRWLPQDSRMIVEAEKDFTTSKDGKNYISSIRWPNQGFRLYSRTIDQGLEVFESANVSVIICDEPPPQPIYEALQFRIRKGGIIIMPATAIGSNATYFQDEFVESPDLYSIDNPTGFKYHASVRAEEACIETSGDWYIPEYGTHPMGNLPLQWIENRRKALRNKPEIMAARLDGKMTVYQGRIIKNYKPNLHFGFTSLTNNPAALSYMMVVDPHDRRPPAVGWFSIDKFGFRQAIREWPSVYDDDFDKLLFVNIKDAFGWTVKMYVERWAEIEAEIGIPENRIIRIMDPNFGTKPVRTGTHAGKTTAQVYRDAAREYLKLDWFFDTNVPDNLEEGHSMLRSIFELDANGDIQYLIDKTCQNMHKSLLRYIWDDFTGKDAEERQGIKEKPKEKWKDFVDIQRYMVMYEPFKWIQPQGDPDSAYYWGDDYTGSKRKGYEGDDNYDPNRDNAPRMPILSRKGK